MSMVAHAGPERHRGGTIWSAMHLAGGAMMLAVGLIALASVPWQQAADHLAARDWPTVEANIQSVSLTEDVDAGHLGTAGRLVLEAAYSYRVEGHSYQGHRVSLDDTGNLDDRRLKTHFGQLRFAELTGRTVAISYDPQDPSNAYVDTAYPWGRGLMFGILGFVVTAVGLGLVTAPFQRPRTAG